MKGQYYEPEGGLSSGGAGECQNGGCWQSEKQGSLCITVSVWMKILDAVTRFEWANMCQRH